MYTNNILKKLKVVILLFATVGITYSCDDFVEELPVSDIAPESFYKNNDQLQLALNGAYGLFSQAYSQFYINTGEIRSDNFQPQGNDASRSSVHNSTMDPGEGYLRWANHYQAIDAVNRIIQSAESVEGVDENIIGQAYAIRAKMYFDMARVWGNLPVFLEPITSISEAFRSQEDYDTILETVVIPDMKKAEEMITTIDSEFTFSQGGVYALQAEVYMWEEEELLAKNAIQNLLALGVHSLVTTPEEWLDLFYNQEANDASPEARGKVQSGSELIFSLFYSDVNTSGLARFYIAGAAVTTISVEVEQKWVERFPADSLGWATKYPDTAPVFSREVLIDGETEIVPVYGDWRQFMNRNGDDYEQGLGSEEFGLARSTKWIKNRSGLNPNEDDTNIPVFRLADMILLLAEAELKLDNAPRCFELINQVRTARQLPLASEEEFGDTFDEQLDFLLVERQFELIGEAKRWWDLVRNDKAIEVMTPILQNREDGAVVPFTEDQIIWPIFIDHLNENDLLEQNLGWR
ncbi:RagB/SusD family nutrient uptake outer membrane protein [Algibacter pectinivorans]|uniref:Starch-binding associating with outer membrane n=1 Tax=Algibacter pectinivorans TaxID=870482 RepID=A0A1I1QYJ1_9FLAO|nr:RagB/SusD family nutrient uptake outer membrane protein [Algibacter pectinivorans]SFD27176.1 Starch-binding associating with outer membrane [Algibacter pectinivorans]